MYKFWRDCVRFDDKVTTELTYKDQTLGFFFNHVGKILLCISTIRNVNYYFYCSVMFLYLFNMFNVARYWYLLPLYNCSIQKKWILVFRFYYVLYIYILYHHYWHMLNGRFFTRRRSILNIFFQFNCVLYDAGFFFS